MISRLQARLDLQILLANGETVRVTKISPERSTWRQNAPGVADELDVDLSSTYLPVDLRAVAGVRVLHWLFEHQDPERCQPGDPGFFFGVADTIDRDRGDHKLGLPCRDMTSVLLDNKVSLKELRSVDLQKVGSLEAVVKRLVDFGGPFAQTWRVRSLTPAGAKTVFRSLTPEVRKVKGKPGKTVAQATQRRLRLDTMAEGDETPVWEVICQLCARMGAVPEIMLARDGVPEVVLVDALDLQTSDVLRPFRRGGKTFRTLTLGRTVGALSESVKLARDADLPDQIVVGTWDHETGKRLEVTFPRDAKPLKGDKLRRVYQVAEGTADVGVLEKLAAAAWAESRQRQLELDVETWSPWTDGGDHRDPDLLSAGSGMALALEVDDVYAFQEAGRVGDAFEGLPAEVLGAFDRAEAARPPVMIFQVGTIDHQYGRDGYTARMKLRTWLGRQP